MIAIRTNPDPSQENMKVSPGEANRLGGLYAYKNYTFDKIKPTKYNSVLIKAAKAFNRNKDNFYIYGPVGSGKTHIATSIMRIHYGSCKKISDIINDVRMASLSDDITDADMIDCYCGVKISTVETYHPGYGPLLIDDIGTEKLTEFSLNVIYRIIDKRLMNEVNGLVITSNKSLDDLSKHLGSDRVSSRIAGMCSVFDLSGESDFRMSK